MSTPTHLAALEDVEDSLKWLREVISGLPMEALDLVPAPGANSITVLVSHALPSTVFWVQAGSGKAPSHRAYVKNHRNQAFEKSGLSEADLIRVIDSAGRAAEAALQDGSEAHLAALYEHDDEPDEPPVTGATCLVHGVSHLREHVGQAALMRDLWLARATKQD
ncbi:MAG: DinB family protein [Dehalococcoidia bacterium]